MVVAEMSQERADKYRRKAEEYRVKAVKAPRDDDKAAWLNHLGLAAGVCEKARVSKIQLKHYQETMSPCFKYSTQNHL
jgi:hypothetical protein